MPGKINTTKQMRPRPTNDWYETPPLLARAAISLIPRRFPSDDPEDPITILDPGAGTGVWGVAAREAFPQSRIVGVELDPAFPAHPDYNAWLFGDFLSFPTRDAGLAAYWRYDYVVGNPPYNLAEEFIEKGLSVLRPNGYLIFLLKLDFLAGRGRMEGLYTKHPPSNVYVLATRPSFYNNGRANAYEFALFMWSKVRIRTLPTQTTVRWLDWNPKSLHASRRQSQTNSGPPSAESEPLAG